MIAKVPPKRKDGKSHFGALVRYLTGDDKVKAIDTQGVLTPETAALEMAAVAARSTRCQDPVYHFALSWPAGERPSIAQALSAGQAAVGALGFAEHQYLIAYHDDTEHAHIHVVLNRVHPESYRALYPKGDYFTLARACCEIEIRQGWSHDRGPYQIVEIEDQVHIVRHHTYPGAQEPAKTRGRALDIEAWTGEQSFHSWIAERPARALREVLGKAGMTWGEVHQTLGRYHLELRTQGSGLVVVDRDAPERLHAKASQLGRFASKAALEQRLGPFMPSPALVREESERGARVSTRSYQRDPDKRLEARLVRQAARERLHNQYRDDAHTTRASLSKDKQAALARQRASERERLSRLCSVMTQLRHDLHQDYPRLDPRVLRSLLALERAREKDRLGSVFRAERQQLRDRYAGSEHVPTWREWVTQKALTDALARAVLRGFQYRDRRARCTAAERAAIEPADLLWDTPALGRDIHGLAWRVEGAGEVTYSWADGTEIFRDLGWKILVSAEAADEPALRAALQIAAEKWGPRVRLTGEAAFKAQAARIAAALGITVVNPELRLAHARASTVPDEHPGAAKVSSQHRPVLDEEVPFMAIKGSPTAPTTRSRDPAPTSSPFGESRLAVPPRGRDNNAEELQAFVRIDLVRYLEGRGYEVDARASTETSIKLRGEDILIVRRRGDGVYEYFNTGDPYDNGTIIQFIQRRDDLNLGEVRKALRASLGKPELQPALTVPDAPRVAHPDHTEVRRRWMLAQLPEQAGAYLGARGLTDPTVRRYRENLRCDARGNALFAHRDDADNIVGYEIKGPAFTGFARGGHKRLALFGNRTNPARIVVTESGIDALSLAQMEGAPKDTLYVSTAGSLGQRTLDALRGLSEQHPRATIVLGMDRDEAGRAMTRDLERALPGRPVEVRSPAHGKD